MLADDRITSVICESDEDYVINQEEPEFVSVKHREPDQGVWTITGLCSEGGVSHLFATWRAKGKAVRCRLQTNAGLKTGKSEARALERACADRDEQKLRAFAENLQDKINAESVDEALDFLHALRIEAGLPKRDDLRATLVNKVRSRADAIGWPVDACDSRFDIVCREVQKASRSDLRAKGREPVVDRNQLDTIARRARAIAAKTIDRERVLTAIQEAERPRGSRGRSLLEQKLLCGGVGPTGRSRARELQREWRRTRYLWSSELPNDALDDIRRDVLRIADQAERHTRHGQGEYGVQMQGVLEELFGTEFADRLPTFVNLDTVMGLVYDETDRCNISWCDDFVPETDS